ncbi:MAG: hypothetical protein KAR42_01510 [candidate division Zixibacteria bacterium]|nr:hypothetical protein [candidate division Zixibacteria bacterium]
MGWTTGQCIGKELSMCSFLSSQNWVGIETIALILTLLFLIRYTKATIEMAKSTKALADAQYEELGLKKKPVMAFYLDSKSFELITTIENLSTVHAKYWSKLTVMINQKTFYAPESSHYGGKKAWAIQAKDVIRGHYSISGLLEPEFETKTDFSKLNVRLRVESWCLNYYDNDYDRPKIELRNPPLEWYWCKERRNWVLEVASDNG